MFGRAVVLIVGLVRVVVIFGVVLGGGFVMVSHGCNFGPGCSLQVHEHEHSGGGHVFPASAMYLNAGFIDWVCAKIV